MEEFHERSTFVHQNGAVLEEEEEEDELYESNDAESEERGEHRLLILHLASQLRINMDISKLSFPANLCERRSILETYSDYFSCADLWLDIAKCDSGKERMIACLKWYLSTFNASRKSKLARKPYNPILGEVFKCKFKVFNNGVERVVTYISEQVSHHPPVLAFHVEDNSGQMFSTGQIYLKTHFLGFSVAMDMVGGATLTLPKREDEKYEITFPKAFCNSIYTTPWLELGGKSRISCVKTGFESIITFKRQGYIFGSRDRVDAFIFKSGLKDPIYSVKGHWSGLMTSKEIYEDEEKTFVNVSQNVLRKALVLPRAKQSDFESRKVWQEVTKYLKQGDTNAATDAKIKIEQDQRNEVSYRKKNNMSWELRYFKKIGDIYEFA